MSLLRARCPTCHGLTAVAVGDGYQCHACGRTFAAGLIRVPRAWGDGGAYARDRDQRDYYTPAFPPRQTVDTIGAGDVFNAGLIHGLARSRPLELAVIEAARLAGRKCGQQGFDNLAA